MSAEPRPPADPSVSPADTIRRAQADLAGHREHAEWVRDYLGVSDMDGFSAHSLNERLLTALDIADALLAVGERDRREVDLQMQDKLDAQECLRLLCAAIDLPLDGLAGGWKASLPIILARLETIVDEGERGFRERDEARTSRERDRQQIARLTEALERIAAGTIVASRPGSDFPPPLASRAVTAFEVGREIARAVLAGEEDAE